MRELPVQWTRASFGMICGKGQYGWTTKAVRRGDVKFLRTTDITKGTIKWSSVPYCEQLPPEINKYIVISNDILISRAGSVGFSTLISSPPVPTVFASYLIRFVPAKQVVANYIAYFLRSQSYWDQITSVSAGIALANVNAVKLADLQVPIAPFNEQKRIAGKLDAVLARVDACRARLDRVPAILKRFRQSVLAAATSGELTEEWRTKNQGSMNWDNVKLADVANARLGKMLDKSKNKGRLTPYLRNVNVRWFSFDLNDIQEIRVSSQEFIELSLRVGDVLICEGGEPGRCAVWRHSSSTYVYQKALHRIRANKKLIPDYLCYVIKNAADDGRLSDLFTGTTIKHLTGISLSQFTFFLPSCEEQVEIVRRVESLFAYADRLETRYTAARAQVEKLTPALLAKAFRGELVPQDPNDEPAAVLLERIRAARAAAPEKRRSKRRATAKTKGKARA